MWADTISCRALQRENPSQTFLPHVKNGRANSSLMRETRVRWFNRVVVVFMSPRVFAPQVIYYFSRLMLSFLPFTVFFRFLEHDLQHQGGIVTQSSDCPSQRLYVQRPFDVNKSRRVPPNRYSYGDGQQDPWCHGKETCSWFMRLCPYPTKEEQRHPDQRSSTNSTALSGLKGWWWQISQEDPESATPSTNQTSPPLSRDQNNYLAIYQREYARVMGFKFVKELEGMTLTEMGGSIQKTAF